MVGRRLTEDEIAAYDTCPEEVARAVRVIRIPFIPGGYAGMTLRKTVLLAKDVAQDGNSALMAHELVHARQWNELGLFGFSRTYVWSFTKNLYRLRAWNEAYQQIGLELEAKQATTEWLRGKSRRSLQQAMEEEDLD